jgi:hypothetical protein
MIDLDLASSSSGTTRLMMPKRSKVSGVCRADTAFLGQVEVAVGLHPLLGAPSAWCSAPAGRAKEISMIGRRCLSSCCSPKT